MEIVETLTVCRFVFGSAAYAQEKPAAQGYIKDKPGNESQDRALKDLEDGKESSQPSEKANAGT